MAIPHNGGLPPLTFDPDFATPADFAGYYRACGLQVVPGWLPGEPQSGSWKRPYLKTWAMYQDELVELTVFRGWYDPVKGTYASRQNLGLVTGRASWNVWVLDLDLQKDPRALAWWQGLLAVHNNGSDIHTVEQVTGGGGIQMLFRAPIGMVVPTIKTAIGVDVRGQGGFAVLPPSHHESGRDYAWKPGHAPWECEIAITPPWLLDAIGDLAKASPGASRASPGSTSNQGEKIDIQGNGHDAFGHVIDGREEYMRNLIWAALIGYYIDSPIGPPSASAMDVIWEDYERNTRPKEPQPGETNSQGLEREGRGWSLFVKKWAAALKHWDTNIPGEAAARAAREKTEQPKAADPAPASDPAKPAAPIPLLWPFPIDERKLPVRDWTVPGLLLKRSLTVLVAPPGTGKSLLTLQLTIAVAVGMSWGGWTPRRPEKVLIVNAEDDLDEIRRRLVAAARSMGVDQQRLEGRIFLAKAPESVVIAKFDNRTKSVIRTPLIEELVATIKQHGIGVVVADPFAETFEGDENSNSEVKWAGIYWREVARQTLTALLLVHHTKKFSGAMAGEADASRGGGALIGTARILVTLFGMTEDEAGALNIPLDERTDYVRFDDAKANYSKIEKARWFKKETVRLANATAFVEGDDVGVLVPWEPPGALDGVSVHTIGLVLDDIDRGLIGNNGPTGQLYTATATSEHKERWAGTALIQHLGCSEVNAKKLIKKWLQTGVLKTVDYHDPISRKPRKGLCAPQQNRPGKEEKFT